MDGSNGSMKDEKTIAIEKAKRICFYAKGIQECIEKDIVSFNKNRLIIDLVEILEISQELVNYIQSEQAR